MVLEWVLKEDTRSEASVENLEIDLLSTYSLVGQEEGAFITFPLKRGTSCSQLLGHRQVA